MSKAKILWVDDQIDLLKSHIIFLNEKGYQIDSCTNGSDALDKISNNRYDVILLDENMPGISGIETLIKIKKIDRNNPKRETSFIDLKVIAEFGTRGLKF